MNNQPFDCFEKKPSRHYNAIVSSLATELQVLKETLYFEE